MQPCTTLAEFQQACERARATGQEVPVLMLDNDTTDAYEDIEAEDPAKVFSMHPYQVMTEALDLLGIPHESV